MRRVLRRPYRPGHDHDSVLTSATDRDVERLSAGLAEAFRTGVPGDLFTSDFFLDGHPPFWWFQIQGLDGFTAWLEGYVAHGPEVTVVRTTTTEDGFLAEHLTSEDCARPWVAHRPPAARLHRPRRTDRRDDGLLQRGLGRGAPRAACRRVDDPAPAAAPPAAATHPPLTTTTTPEENP